MRDPGETYEQFALGNTHRIVNFKLGMSRVVKKVEETLSFDRRGLDAGQVQYEAPQSPHLRVDEKCICPARMANIVDDGRQNHCKDL